MQTNTTEQSFNTKLAKPCLLELYVKSSAPSFVLENITQSKELKEIYSKESLTPVTAKEFTLPMSKAIVPPRRTDAYNTKGSYTQMRKNYKPYQDFDENDKGIMTANDNKHSDVSNAPLWFDSKETSVRKEDFSMEGIASRQFSLEEEKANFRKKAEGLDKVQAKAKVEEIFASFEDGGEFSNVDIKFEESLKSTFNDPAIASATGAINLGELEAELLAEPKDEEAPVWDSLTAEEIKRESQEHINSWGITLESTKDIHYDFAEEAAIPNISYKEINPFCHKSLNVNELERVWYYNDNQNCTQGPFSSIEMHDWYKGRYFHPGLLIRCGEDSAFITLRDFFLSISYKPNEERVANQQNAYYESHNLAMDDLAGQFSPLSLENASPYYHQSPMVRYMAPMSTYYQNYPSQGYVSGGYVSSTRPRSQYQAYYLPDRGMFFAGTRPSYR